MTNLQTVDPLAPLYNVQGFDDVRLHYKKDLEDVNYLVKIAHNSRGKVTTDRDWGVIAKLFEFWTRKWPEEWQEFGQTIVDIRETRLNKRGTSKSNEIKYVGTLPLRFMKLIQIVFTEQEFDKKFVYALTNRIKILKVGEKNDCWFTV